MRSYIEENPFLIQELEHGDIGHTNYSLDPTLLCASWYEKRVGQDWQFVLALSNSGRWDEEIAISELVSDSLFSWEKGTEVSDLYLLSDLKPSFSFFLKGYSFGEVPQGIIASGTIQHVTIKPDELQLFHFDAKRTFELGVFTGEPEDFNIIMRVHHDPKYFLKPTIQNLLKDIVGKDTTICVKCNPLMPKFLAISNDFVVRTGDQAEAKYYIISSHSKHTVDVYKHLSDNFQSARRGSSHLLRYLSRFRAFIHELFHPQWYSDLLLRFRTGRMPMPSKTDVHISDAGRGELSGWHEHHSNLGLKGIRQRIQYGSSDINTMESFILSWQVPEVQSVCLYSPVVSTPVTYSPAERGVLISPGFYPFFPCEFILLPRESYKQTVVDRFWNRIMTDIGYHRFMIILDRILIIIFSIALCFTLVQVFQTEGKRRKLRAKSSTQIEKSEVF